MRGKEDGRTVVAVKFLKEFEENSLKIRRKKIKGTQITVMTIRDKGIVEIVLAEGSLYDEVLLKEKGSNKTMDKCGVELVADNILKIDY